MLKSSTTGLGRSAAASEGAARFDPRKYVSPHLNEDDILAIKEVFDALDTTGDGKVERQEMQSAIVAMGIPLDASEGIQELTGGSGNAPGAALDFDSFVGILAKQQAKGQNAVSGENLFKLFLQLDNTWNCKWNVKKATGISSMTRKGSAPSGAKWAAKGALTWEDLKQLTSDLGEQVDDDYLKDMVLALDADEDGVLGPDDFYNAVHHAKLALEEQQKRELLAVERGLTGNNLGGASFGRASSFGDGGRTASFGAGGRSGSALGAR